MKTKTFVLMTALLLGLVSLAFSQSKETGSIQGLVLDQEKVPLPGVTVTLSSPNLMGTRTAVTDASGLYRFPALPPGIYQVKAQLQGFKTHIQESIRLQTTASLSIDIIMTQSSVEEEVTVVAQAPTVDTKSTESASVTLTSEILRNIPYNQFSSNIVNLAPGVTLDESEVYSYGGSAYGSQDGTGIAYSLDGVNVADPEGGTAWVFLDHNIIEEAKVMGVGLPAEYGNFTGVIFNIVTKSGGNQFSGHFEVDFQGEKNDWPEGFWQQDNIDAYLDDYPDLTAPRYKFYDASMHVGGPIKKDKVWFYQGLQFQHFEDYFTGFLGGPRAYDQPHSFTKLTAQLSPSTNMIFGFEIDSYNGENRGAGITVSPEGVVNQESPEVVGNFSLTHIFSPKTFLDVKAAYFWGYYYLEPKTGRQTYAHFDLDENLLKDNSGWYYLADRSRFQANVSLTHYAENFITGNHDFKFGVEVERSTCRSRFGYTGEGGPLGNYVYYVDYWSYNQYYGYDTGNYLAYQYEGYDFNSPYTRVEGFVQDAWQITPRLNINAGLRFSQNWGQVEGKGTVYNTNRIAPRIGLTFDLFGDKKTILKAHYGQFTEAMLAAYFNRLSRVWSDYISYYWDLPGGQWVEFETIKQNWKMQDGIKHPYLNQFTVSLERELFKDASVSVSYIHRDFKNIIGVYDTLAVYEPADYYVSELGTNYTIYNLVSGNAHEFVIENIKPGPDRPYYGERGAYRRYQGLEFLFNKRFSNKWQLMLSYVYSRTKGTIDNTWAADIGWQHYEGPTGIIAGDPNYWINADGHSTYDPTHMIKIQGTYVLPYEIYFNAYFRGITGRAWAQTFRTEPLNQGRETFFTEPRGSNHYPMATSLDLRLEKTFILSGKYRLGLMIDCFNLFNTDKILNWGTIIGYDWNPGTLPSTDGHELLEIVDPRQFRLGIRFTF